MAKRHSSNNVIAQPEELASIDTSRSSKQIIDSTASFASTQPQSASRVSGGANKETS